MALTKVTYSMISGAPVNVLDFGAKGDGSTDDTTALNNALASGSPVYIPDTGNFYMISDTLNIKGDIYCDGKIKTIAGFTGDAMLTDGASRAYLYGLQIYSTDTRATGTVGLHIDDYFVTAENCKVFTFERGIAVSIFGVTLQNCTCEFNDINLSCYAVDTYHQFNDLNVIGGTYDSAASYAARFGDPHYATTVPLADPLASVVNVTGVAFDSQTVTIDRVCDMTMQGCYFEFSTASQSQGAHIVLGGTADNNNWNILITGCFFNTAEVAIRQRTAIKNLMIGPNHYRSIKYCALYAVSIDLSPIRYQQGTIVGAFLGPEVHTGFRSVSTSDITFNGTTLDYEGLLKGAQNVQLASDQPRWYPYAKSGDGYTNKNANRRYYSTPATGIAGSLNGNLFTFTNLTDSYKFNGGDAVQDSIGGLGTTYVQVVNYANGTMIVDGYTASPTACTMSQRAFNLTAQSVYASAAPVSGTWYVGDVVYNTAPTSGGYVGWVCTTAGTPGTWKTFGVIS